MQMRKNAHDQNGEAQETKARYNGSISLTCELERGLPFQGFWSTRKIKEVGTKQVKINPKGEAPVRDK